MFDYFAYSLGIKSELEIPEFIPFETNGDVTIKIKKDGQIKDYLSPEIYSQTWHFQLSRQQAFFYLQDTGLFRVENGNKIEIILTPETSLTLMRQYLVGIVMSVLLYQRGMLVLHASAVNFQGSAVAFLGVSGQGKSSTAAALHTQGYTLINDDVAPVNLGKGKATITPGFPQIKLSEEIATALGYDFESFDLLHPVESKRGYRFTNNLVQKPLPIRRIYLLADGDELKIEPLTPQQAVIELSRHAHPSSLYYSKDPSHFFQCVTLAQECTIYRLVRSRNLALLPKLVDAIAEHINDNLAIAKS
ncbi:MAG: hypothetical protein SAL07_18275 [Oscillatoria sp. PMC 1051.18]|nr:hypothetical protein [Oscillatoria sp. PMC 1050.18]MEC5031851.1 hypothetical protein [Oscillatoria sp. PMC 1051.18]